MQILTDRMTERIIHYCTEHGLMCTNQRLLIADKLQELDTYTDAVELWLHLKREKHAISISCVYRGLDLLVNAGLATTSRNENRQRTYRINGENLAR